MEARDRGTVSARDRDYMRRLGKYIADANEEAKQEHLDCGGGERLDRSLNLAERGRSYAATNPDADDPSAFYARARALGLIKSRRS
jgi:hypothetical protein